MGPTWANGLLNGKVGPSSSRTTLGDPGGTGLNWVWVQLGLVTPSPKQPHVQPLFTVFLAFHFSENCTKAPCTLCYGQIVLLLGMMQTMQSNSPCLLGMMQTMYSWTVLASSIKWGPSCMGPNSEPHELEGLINHMIFLTVHISDPFQSPHFQACFAINTS